MQVLPKPTNEAKEAMIALYIDPGITFLSSETIYQTPSLQWPNNTFTDSYTRKYTLLILVSLQFEHQIEMGRL